MLTSDSKLCSYSCGNVVLEVQYWPVVLLHASYQCPVSIYSVTLFLPFVDLNTSP